MIMKKYSFFDTSHKKPQLCEILNGLKKQKGELIVAISGKEKLLCQEKIDKALILQKLTRIEKELKWYRAKFPDRVAK